jgi:hypothetical protein
MPPPHTKNEALKPTLTPRCIDVDKCNIYFYFLISNQVFNVSQYALLLQCHLRYEEYIFHWATCLIS